MRSDKFIRFIQSAGACLIILYCGLRLWNDARLPSQDIVSRTASKDSAVMERWQEECVFIIFIGLGVALLIYSRRKESLEDTNR